MAYKVFYKASAGKDLKKPDPPAAKRLLAKLEKVLSDNPDSGTRLAGQFEGLFRYRAGDYRSVYTKIAGGVLVLRIAHRREVYR